MAVFIIKTLFIVVMAVTAVSLIFGLLLHFRDLKDGRTEHWKADTVLAIVAVSLWVTLFIGVDL